MIRVQVNQIVLSNVGFAVLLKGIDDDRTLPIVIGAAEAQSIALCLNKVQVPRPLTHDLMRSVLHSLECPLVRMEVCDLKDGTFYAKLVLNNRGTEMLVDSRPSDAIALALRFGAAVYVDESVMEEAGQVFDASDLTGEQPEAQTTEKHEAQKLTHIEVLEKKLNKAVTDERYEDAATLRDEIQHLKETQGEN
jgi:hypothetical protein